LHLLARQYIFAEESMRIKQNILYYLKKDNYVSGKFLAEKLGISRVAVWKQIQKLKNLHYEIISHKNLGYCIISQPDLLLPDEIHKGLNTKYIGHKIYYYQELESSNLTAKEKARSKRDVVPEGTVIITEKQKGGRGRLGRKWFSPIGGIWLSVILYPSLSPEYIPCITLMTSVAIVRAIKELTGIQGLIKWPNDVMIHDKKVCGILTEMSAEMDLINWLVVGIGINVNIDRCEFAKEIKDISISLKEMTKKRVSRIQLVQIFLREFEKYYNMLIQKESTIILNEWKNYSHTIGKRIDVKVGDRLISGQAIDINDRGALMIKKDDGEILEIISGTLLKYNKEPNI